MRGRAVDPAAKKAKFVNFDDDGFEVRKHLGLVETERAKDRKKYLLGCWRGEIRDFPSSFMVEAAVEDTDEWLHSFYYYNDEIPTEEDFMNSIADYLTFEFNMIAHGRGYLFEDIDHIGKDIQGGEDVAPLNEKEWRAFPVGELFTLEPGKGKGANHLKSDSNGISYLGATNRNNGVVDYVQPVPEMIQAGNCIAFIRNGEGSMGYAVYKLEPFIATSDITVGYADFLNRYTGIFVTAVADKVRRKYNFNYKRSDTRLKKELLQLPVDSSGNPDWDYMERYMKRLENILMLRHLNKKQGPS